jgi:hypothetical protein
MKSVMIILALLLTSVTTGRSSGLGPRVPVPVSMLQLIATPERFDGKSVGAIGYLVLHNGGGFLYLHREDSDFGLYVNALKIEFDRESSSDDPAFDSHYLYLIGSFDAKDKGPLSAFGGSIKNAKVIALWSAPKIPLAK